MKKSISLLALAMLGSSFQSTADVQGVVDKVAEAFVFTKDHTTTPFNYGNMVQLRLANSPINLAGCDTTHLVFSLDPAVEPNGQAMYSTVLTAMASERNIRIAVTNDKTYGGHCAISWLTMQ